MDCRSKTLKLSCDQQTSCVPDKEAKEECRIHAEEFIKFYCREHDVVGCTACTILYHRTCRLGYIPDIAKTFKEGEEFKTLLASLSELGEQLDDLHKFIQECSEAVEKIDMAVVKEIEKFREDLDIFLDEMFYRQLTKADDMKKSNVQKIRDLCSRHAGIKQQVNDFKTQLQENDGEPEKLVVFVKRFRSYIDTLKRECSALKQNVNIHKYVFTPTDNIRELIDRPQPFGDLRTQRDVSRLHMTPTSKIALKSPDDTYIPLITGMTLMSDKSLLIADYQNSKLKLINTNSQVVTSRLNVAGHPWDVTRLPDDKAAATICDKKMIQIVSADGELSFNREFSVDDKCRGICYADNKLFVTFVIQGKVAILGLNGSVYKTIALDNNGICAFIWPEYIALQLDSNDRKYIYVSDNDSVTKLTLNGEIITKFSGHGLSSPRKLVALGDNIVSVSCYDDNTIFVLSEEEGRMQVLKKWPCVRNPFAIEFSSHNYTMYISRPYTEHLHVYNLSEQES